MVEKRVSPENVGEPATSNVATPVQSQLEQQRNALKRKRTHSADEEISMVNHLSGNFTHHGSGSAFNANVFNAQNITFQAGLEDYKTKDDDLRLLILTNLAYEDMWSRKSQVDENAGSSDSVEWIWSSNFSKWLRDPVSPIFWVTGSPGCGKSTLMKHISDSTRTVSILNEQGPSWTIMRFFFDFRAGNSMANSVAGFIRSLLYQFVEEYISHTTSDTVLTNRMLVLKDISDATTQQLMQKFCNIVASMRARICAFVDGLDEFTGDFATLVNALSELKNHAGLKLCLASRDWPLFRTRFVEFPHLTVDHYNHQSIKHYFGTAWLASPFFDDAPPQLSEELLRSARGNFVWVKGAVHRLIQMREQCQPFDKLLQEVKQMPEEVLDLYEQNLDRLRPDLRREAAVMLKLIVESGGRVELDRLSAAFWTVVKRADLERLIQCQQLASSTETRIQALLGCLVEIRLKHDCSEQHLHDSTQLCDSCMLSGPRLLHNGASLTISRVNPTEVRLTHETLYTGFRDRPWMSDVLPKQLVEKYPNNIWIRIYLEEIGSLRFSEHGSTGVVSNKLSKILHSEHNEDKNYRSKDKNSPPNDEKAQYDMRCLKLLRSLNYGENDSPLIPYALQLIMYELERLSNITEDVLDLLHCTMSQTVWVPHYVVCSIFHGEFSGCSSSDGCGFLCQTDSRNELVESSNPLLEFIAISVAHGLIEIASYFSKHYLMTTTEHKQAVFDLVLERYLCSELWGVTTSKTRVIGILNEFIIAGCKIQGQQFCLMFQNSSHAVRAANLFTVVLEQSLSGLQSVFSQSIGQHHAFCSWEGLDAFLTHWLRFTEVMYDLCHGHDNLHHQIQSLLTILVGRGCRIDKMLPDGRSLVKSMLSLRQKPWGFATLVRAGADLSGVVSNLKSQILECKIGRLIASSDLSTTTKAFFQKEINQLLQRSRRDTVLSFDETLLTHEIDNGVDRSLKLLLWQIIEQQVETESFDELMHGLCDLWQEHEPQMSNISGNRKLTKDLLRNKLNSNLGKAVRQRIETAFKRENTLKDDFEPGELHGGSHLDIDQTTDKSPSGYLRAQRKLELLVTQLHSFDRSDRKLLDSGMLCDWANRFTDVNIWKGFEYRPLGDTVCRRLDEISEHE